MTGIITRLGVEVSGPEVTRLPRYTPAITATSGLVRRYSMPALPDSQVGLGIASVPDTSGAGGSALRQNLNAAYQPVLTSSGGLRYASLDGVNDYFLMDITLAQPYTVAIIAKVPAFVSNGYLVTALGGSGLNLFENVSAGLTLNAGSSLAQNDPDISTGWHLLAGVANGASSAVQQDSSRTTGNAGSNNIAIQLGFPSSASPRAMSIMEILVWNRALSQAELTATYTELQGGHGF